MGKLSAAQVKALEALSAMPNEGIAQGRYLIEDRGIELLTLYELEDMYLLNCWSEQETWELTDAGRAALAEHKLIEHHRAGHVAELAELVAKEGENE